MCAEGPPPYSSEFERLIRKMHEPGKDAPGYEGWIQDHLGRRIEEIEERIIPSIRRFTETDRRSALDFGCGTGSSMVALVRAGCVVTGIDPDEFSCELARRRLSEHRLEAEVLLVPDTSSLPFESGSFDLVLANGVFEHIRIRERKTYFDEAWRVLRTGGILYLAETPNRLIPFDFHTTGLFLLPWLPAGAAKKYARFRGRIAEAMDIELSGYRGMTWRELKGFLRGKPHTILNDRADPDDLDFLRQRRFHLKAGWKRNVGRRIFYGAGKIVKAAGISPRYFFPNVEGAIRKD